MRGRPNPQRSLPAIADLEERIPQDHPRRRIKEVADTVLKRLSPEFNRIDAPVGRASVSQERLLKASLLITLYSVWNTGKGVIFEIAVRACRSHFDNIHPVRQLLRVSAMLGITWLLAVSMPGGVVSASGQLEPAALLCPPLSRPPALQLYRDPTRDLVHAAVRTPAQFNPNADCPSPLPATVPPEYRPPYPIWRDVTGTVLQADGTRDPNYSDPFPFRVWILPSGTIRHSTTPELATNRSLAYQLNLTWGTTPGANDAAVMALLNAKGVNVLLGIDVDWRSGFDVRLPLCGNKEEVLIGLSIDSVDPWYWNCQNESGQLVRLRLDAQFINDRGSLPSEIGQLQQLEQLKFTNSRGASLPPEIGRLARLEHLLLDHNQLTILPPELGRLQRLYRLDLSNNQLATLPPEIGQLASLERLYLSHNQLTQLPPEIRRLQRLRRLDLSYNQLTDLPPEIGQLYSLKGLRLHWNQLTNLPPEIGQLRQLERLSLYSNRLNALPPEFGQLTFPPLSWVWTPEDTPFNFYYDPAFLYLSHNQLGSLPTEFSRLRLSGLDLSHNQLTKFPSEVVQNGLVFLDLSHNQLTTLPPEIGLLGTMEKLDLSHNHLRALPPEIGQLAFWQTTDSKLGISESYLDLSHNRLTTLPLEFSRITFMERPHSNHIDLRHNQFEVPPPVIGKLAWVSVDLRHNPLTCWLRAPEEHGLNIHDSMPKNVDDVCPD